MKPPPLNPPHPSSENTPNGRENRRSRRRRQKRSSQEAELEASGSTLPTPPGPGTPTQNPAVASTSGTSKGTFEEGEDFIPFGLGDVSDDERVVKITPAEAGKVGSSPDSPGRSLGKGKGKEREGSPVRERTPPREEDRERNRKDRRRDRERDRSRERDDDRDKDKDRDGKRDRSRDRDRDRDGDRYRDRARDRDRDMDRDGGRERHRDRDAGAKRKQEFDPNDGYANKKQRLDASTRKSPWVAGLDWDQCNHVAEILHKEVEAFVNYISPSPVEDEIRGLTISLIAKAVTSAFPDATVYPFGSYETKLYLPLGDIDLVILSQSMAYSDKVTVLHALANTIKRAGITQRVTIIAKAKVPIVKFITTHGRFNVDISINQENGIVSGNIINGFLRDMHGSGPGGKGSLALRSLVMITKAFLSQRSMNEVFSGGLGSYGIVCLAVSFLQMHPKIRRGEIDADKNLGVLMMEFFELYGCYFNYQEVGISVRDGGTYFSKRQRGWYDYYKGNLLSIEDPADPSNDISKGSFAFQKVRATFAGAHGILTSTAYLIAGILNARRQGRSVSLRDRDKPEELSILSSVMGVTQETINHRKLVQELYDKRVLHNLLGVKPQPVIGNCNDLKILGASNGSAKPPSSSNSREAKSVKTAWQEADVEHEDAHHKRHREVDLDDDEEGRYSIGRQQPPKKRRRKGNLTDTHTVFTTDDDDDNSVMSEDDEEEAHYASDVESSRSIRDPEKTDKRRSYWLSKAIGIDSEGSM